MKHNAYRDMFKSSTLKEMFDDFYKSDARDLRSEIATQRTMMGALMSKIPAEMEPETVPIELIEMIIKLSRDVSGSIEKYDRMQHRLNLVITADQFRAIVWKMLEKVQEILSPTPEEFINLATSFEKLDIHRTQFTTMEVQGELVHDYGAEVEVTEGRVTETNVLTRYNPDGTVTQATPEEEIAWKESKREYISSARPNWEPDKPLVNEVRHGHDLPNTRIDGMPVQGSRPTIADNNDPYYFPGENL